MTTRIVDRPTEGQTDPVFGSQIIFDRTAEGVARVWVIDGKSRQTTTYYAQALRYAAKFIDQRIVALGAELEAA